MSPNVHARLTLELTSGLGLTTTTRLVAALESPGAVVEAKAAQLAEVEGVGKRRATTIRRGIDETIRSGRVEAELAAVEAAGAWLLSPEDEAFPRLLRYIPDPPSLLWVRGRLDERDAMSVAIVGSRRCTLYGREQADRFGGQLAEAGLTVVSGGAYGIDKAAHDGALAVRGRTLAVLGSGLGTAYPAAHRPLFDRIVHEDAGAVISEFPMAAPPQRTNFHRRNRLISGLSLGTLVIEAGKHSGALITARQCVEDHGRELMALPGRVDSPMSTECHRILREGWATLVTCPGDVLDALGQSPGLGEATRSRAQPPHPSAPEGPHHAEPAESVTLFPDTQQTLLEAMDAPRSIDELAAITGLDVARIRSELTVLQVRGRVAARGGLYQRKAAMG
ncbi:MAG: DNA-processing protein DprA [Phycisphaeraceae bacterium]